MGWILLARLVLARSSRYKIWPQLVFAKAIWWPNQQIRSQKPEAQWTLVKGCPFTWSIYIYIIHIYKDMIWTEQHGLNSLTGGDVIFESSQSYWPSYFLPTWQHPGWRCADGLIFISSKIGSFPMDQLIWSDSGSEPSHNNHPIFDMFSDVFLRFIYFSIFLYFNIL